MKTSKITTINSKPIGVQFHNIRTQLPSIKKLVLKHNSISWCISASVRFVRFTKSSMSLYQYLTTQRLPWIQKNFTFLISNKFATFKNIKIAKIILIIKIFQCVTSLYILFYISDITHRKIFTINKMLAIFTFLRFCFNILIVYGRPKLACYFWMVWLVVM